MYIYMHMSLCFTRRMTQHLLWQRLRGVGTQHGRPISLAGDSKYLRSGVRLFTFASGATRRLLRPVFIDSRLLWHAKCVPCTCHHHCHINQWLVTQSVTCDRGRLAPLHAAHNIRWSNAFNHDQRKPVRCAHALLWHVADGHCNSN